MNRSLLLALLLTTIACSAFAQQLSCADRANEHLWVKKVRVDAKAKTVFLTLAQAPTSRKAVLTNASESQFGKPVYAFNLPPVEGAEPVTNVFKLFYTGTEWRLIEAGLLQVNGVLTLRALGQSVALTCKEAA